MVKTPSLEKRVLFFRPKNGRVELTKLSDSDLDIELIATLRERNGYYIGLYRKKTEENSTEENSNRNPNYFLIEVKYNKIIPKKKPYKPIYTLNSASTITAFETIEEASRYIQNKF